MQLAHPETRPISGVFGDGYVAERHRDAAVWNLAAPDTELNDVISSLTVSMLDEALKSLRSALSLRRS